MHHLPAGFSLSSSNDLIHISTMLMTPPPHSAPPRARAPRVAQMANGIFSSLGRLGDGSRFSVLPILAPAFIRSQGIVSTSSICVNSAVVFSMRHYLKTYLLPCERATTMGQRLPRPPRTPAGQRGSLPVSTAVPGGCPAAPPPAGACPRRAWRGSDGARDARR